MTVTGLITAMIVTNKVKITAINLLDNGSVNPAGRMNDNLMIDADNTFDELGDKT
jgi:hypothetical protein